MKRILATLLTIAVLAAARSVSAAPFELAITPSRVEVTGKSGARVGQSIELINVGSAATELSVRTLDWTFSDEGDITYFDELRAGSCRPWVTLERRFVQLPPQGRLPFRFQVDVPADAIRGECRFMLAIEGVEPAYRAQIQSGGASLSLPVSGRIAIAVYVTVNGAEPRLQVVQVGVKEIRGQRQPVLTVSNVGDAHGRLDGALDSVDGRGQKFQLVPEGTPVMPGQTRTLLLQPRVLQDQKPPAVEFPIRSEGQLDWELGSFKFTMDFK